MSSVQIVLDSDVAKYQPYQTVYYIVADGAGEAVIGDDGSSTEIYQVQTVVPEVVPPLHL